MCSCRASRASGCRCRSAARPIISAPTSCARSGGWDAYNVTEDADLGMRLARLGHRTDVIASTTYEEAPARLGSLAAPAHALVQRLDANLERAYAAAAPAPARARTWRLPRIPAHRRRQRARRAAASAVHGEPDLFAAGGAIADGIRRCEHRHSDGHARGHGRPRLRGLGLCRLHRVTAARTSPAAPGCC